MALRIKSGIKKHRQSLKKRARNTDIKTGLKTQVKNLFEAIDKKDVDAATQLLKETEVKMKKAASKGVMHKKTASRRVSRFAKKVNALSA